MLPSWALLTVIIIGGIVVVAANSFYPLAKDREAKERLARDAKTILMPEVKSNLERIATLENLLKQGQIPSTGLDVSAWETVSRGGLLLGLKPDEITKFLSAYGIVYRVNDLLAKILESLTGVSSALTGVANTRQMYVNDLNGALTQLQPLLTDLSKSP
jgi:hypothetical protein